MVGFINKCGYRMVLLTSSARVRKTIAVHRLVLLAFVGPAPDGHEAGHRNGNRRDNSLANLQWITRAENISDLIKHGKLPRGESHPHAKLNSEQVREIRRLYRDGYTRNRISRIYGVSWTSTDAIVSGKYWRHVA